VIKVKSISNISSNALLLLSLVYQSVYCLTTDWTTVRSGFDPRQRQEKFSSSLSVQTCSGVHPTSYPMGIEGPFPGAKSGHGVTLTTHHLVLRSRMSRSYRLSPLPLCAFMTCSGTTLLYFMTNKILTVPVITVDSSSPGPGF
jgi:hypothetical protein